MVVDSSSWDFGREKERAKKIRYKVYENFINVNKFKL